MSVELTTRLNKKFISRSFILITGMSVAASLSLLAILLTQFEVISRKEVDLNASLAASEVAKGKVISTYQLTSQLPRKMSESECLNAVQSKLRVENPYKESNGQYTYHYQPMYKQNNSHCGVTIEFSTNTVQLTPRKNISVIYIDNATKQSLIHSLLEK
ncbi:hypothetical protein [Erwinia oleae]|uniref:hypothetical protein n=1 Tax=Erwinia oleae TaxID=796334 RepID=UPI000558F8C9|nr:hypothetical protein [Erwinia oleae]